MRVLEGLAVLERVGFPGAGGERVDVREVRRFLRGRLDGTGLDMGDLDLVVSEIVTNAECVTAFVTISLATRSRSPMSS
ncbi:MAG TPA: hypothetical protein VHJ17_15230, partial [Thermomonospora sp.]|nr:hypothetical protein [Thermomonospora sp.]